MCGRVFVKTSVEGLMAHFTIARRSKDDGLDDFGPRYNGAPGRCYPLIVQYYPLIILAPDEPGGMFMRARWGLIPRWMKGPKGGPRPINAVSETLAEKPMFRAAYRSRRALMPIDGFFERLAIEGVKGKQPYAIAMADGKPFAVAAIWEPWRNPKTREDIKTFCVLTCPANKLVGQIHHRMPVIIAPEDYARWISDLEPDPRDLLKPYPSDLMKMWPISTRVNKPQNDDPHILDPEEGDVIH